MGEPTSKRLVRLRCVHAEDVLVERSQIARLRSGSDFAFSIVNDQGVRRGEQAVRVGLIFQQGIPDGQARLLDRLVGGDGIRSLVVSARHEHVDGRRRHAERGVVPPEGHIVADLVVLRPGQGGWRDQLHAAGWQAWVEDGGAVFVPCSGTAGSV